MFGTVCPAVKFKFEVPGDELGATDNQPPSLGFVTVTFRATAVAFAGTGDPAAPAIGSVKVP
jgi:hypothetical protein